jgi:hypothetical protein
MQTFPRVYVKTLYDHHYLYVYGFDEFDPLNFNMYMYICYVYV